MAELIIDKKFMDLGKKFEVADRLAPSKLSKGLDRVGNKIKRGAKDVSPDGKDRNKSSKKKLKNRWSATRTTKDYDGSYVKKVYSRAPHFHLVERGHRVVARRVNIKNSKFGAQRRAKESGGKTYVEGSHFFDRYMDLIENDVDLDIEEMFDKIFEDIGL